MKNKKFELGDIVTTIRGSSGVVYYRLKGCIDIAFFNSDSGHHSIGLNIDDSNEIEYSKERPTLKQIDAVYKRNRDDCIHWFPEEHTRLAQLDYAIALCKIKAGLNE